MGNFVAVLAILFLLFIVVPLVELALLLKLGAMTQWWVSLLVVIGTGVLGSLLARRQGWHTYRRIQRELQQGQLPTDSLLDAAMIFVAGALLLTPGLLTDMLGMSLLLPVCRSFYKKRLIAWIKKRFSIESFTPQGNSTGQHSEIIDSYVVGYDKQDDHSVD